MMSREDSGSMGREAKFSNDWRADGQSVVHMQERRIAIS